MGGLPPTIVRLRLSTSTLILGWVGEKITFLQISYCILSQNMIKYWASKREQSHMTATAEKIFIHIICLPLSPGVFNHRGLFICLEINTGYSIGAEFGII